MKQILFLLLVLGFSSGLYSQNEVRCAHGDGNYTPQQLAQARKMEERLASISTFNFRLEEDQVYAIPVVFHIVYNTSNQYISMEQVLSQLKVLNTDYRRLNSDTSIAPDVFRLLGADAKIEFCLAKQDPNGLPTTGVTYTSTTNTSFNYDLEDVKYSSTGGIEAWDTKKYLNVWVCNLQGGVLGYVPYPLSPGTTADGVTISYKAFGTIGNLSSNFNLGRTTTHEVGHWFGLYHPWGIPGGAACSTDYVDDTPHQAGSTSSSTTNCPVFPYIDIQCSDQGPNGRIFPTFMDYTKDACMNLFTKGQVERMRTTLVATRSSILSSSGCLSPFKHDLAVSEIKLDTASFCGDQPASPTVRISNLGNGTINGYSLVLTFNNVPTDTVHWKGVLLPGKDTVWTFSSNTNLVENNRIEVSSKVTSPSTDEYLDNNSKVFDYKCTRVLGIYPNPVIDILKIRGNSPTVISATFYNLAGKEMLKVDYPYDVDLRSFQPGFYLGVFETDQNKIRQQLIVIH
jgi:hypothetical protein